MSKKTYAALIGIAAVLLLVCLCGIGVVLVKNNASSKYDKYISVAREYYESADYEAAVNEYKEAIEADKKNEEAYIGIAETYMEMNDMENAVAYLEQGYKETGSPAIKNMLNSYRDIMQNGGGLTYSINEVMEASADVTVREDLLQVFSTYSCADYDAAYTAVAASADTQKQYEGLPVIFNYEASPEGEDRPASVTLTSISYLFNGFTKGVSFERLSQLELSNLVFEYSEVYQRNVVAFDSGGCHIVIESDENGNIVSDKPWNLISVTSAQTEEEDDEAEETAEEGYAVLKGTAYNKAEGGTAERVDIKIYSGDKADDKYLYAEFDTTSSGKYRTEIEPGKYIVQVLIDKEVVYETECEIKNEGDVEKLDLPYEHARELRDGEIRVILSWDDPNANLNHILEGRNSEGEYVFCSHSSYDDGNHEHYVGDELVISSGPEQVGGPEAITVFDIGGYYEYTVVSDGDSIAGAKVEVYTAGSDTPIVYECPSDYTGTAWSVFVYENGDVRAM